MSKPQCPQSPTRAHHTRYESPQGKTSKGICVHCGRKDELPNSVTFNHWFKKSKDRPKN